MIERITVGIPTRDRPQALARLLASLSSQTYLDFDLMIVNDSSGPMLDKAGEMMLDAIRSSGHKVSVVEGVRINQAYSHNHVLWSMESHDWILRVDDDMILSPDYIERLVDGYNAMSGGTVELGAFSGTIFTDHVWSRDEHPPVTFGKLGSTEVGSRGSSLRAMTFMQESIENVVIPTQHLYSSYLYNKQAMQQAGGFPVVYSRGVSYHEETDASYRLYLAGYGLYLITAAKAIHATTFHSWPHRRPAWSHWPETFSSLLSAGVTIDHASSSAMALSTSSATFIWLSAKRSAPMSPI